MSFEYLTAVRDIIVSGAAIITSTVAILGLRKWEKELKGKAEFEVARNLVLSASRLYYELQVFRLSHKKFILEDLPILPLKERRDSIRDNFNNTSKPMQDAYFELYKQTIEAEVFWGEEVKATVIKLLNYFNKLIIYTRQYINYLSIDNVDFSSDKALEEETRKIFAISENDNDDFTKGILTELNNIKKLMSPYIKHS